MLILHDTNYEEKNEPPNATMTLWPQFAPRGCAVSRVGLCCCEWDFPWSHRPIINSSHVRFLYRAKIQVRSTRAIIWAGCLRRLPRQTGKLPIDTTQHPVSLQHRFSSFPHHQTNSINLSDPSTVQNLYIYIYTSFSFRVSCVVACFRALFCFPVHWLASVVFLLRTQPGYSNSPSIHSRRSSRAAETTLTTSLFCYSPHLQQKKEKKENKQELHTRIPNI